MTMFVLDEAHTRVSFQVDPVDLLLATSLMLDQHKKEWTRYFATFDPQDAERLEIASYVERIGALTKGLRDITDLLYRAPKEGQ